MKVLFIDSGIGGLTTLKACVVKMPWLDFIYYADDKYSPYGNLSATQITSRLLKITHKFKNVGVVVLACNTATACAVEELRSQLKVPVIGIEPAIKPAAKVASKVLVLATPVTSGHYRLAKLCTGATCPIEIAPMPNLAKLVDGYYLHGDAMCGEEIINCLQMVKQQSQGASHIVLGCTHYVFISGLISKITGKQVCDGNEGVANELLKKLANLNALPRLSQGKHNLVDKGNIKYSYKRFKTSSRQPNLCKKYAKIFNQTLANS